MPEPRIDEIQKQVNAAQVGAYRSEKSQHYLLQIASEWSGALTPARFHGHIWS